MEEYVRDAPRAEQINRELSVSYLLLDRLKESLPAC